MMKNPCYKCPTRSPGCHGECEKYQEFRREVDKLNENKRLQTISTCTENKILKRIMHRRWSDKRK